MKKFLYVAMPILILVAAACGDKDSNAQNTDTSQNFSQSSPEDTVRSYMQAYANKNADGINGLLCNNDPSSELWAEASMWDGIDSIRIEDAEYTVQEQGATTARVSFAGKLIAVSEDETEVPVTMYFELHNEDGNWCVAGS